jgi:hypothetical protein
MMSARCVEENEVRRTGRLAALGSLAALALCWPPAQSWAQMPAAAAPAGSGTLATAAGQMAPTNLFGVYAFTAPPAEFDRETATAEELARYGYPSRPDPAAGAEALAEWREETAPSLEPVIPELTPSAVYHRPMVLLEAGEGTRAAASLNWSGYAVVGAAGAVPFYSALGHWTVPTVRQRFGACSTRGDYSAQWVGIDGFDNRHLLQSGSEADAFCAAGQQQAEYYPWVEWLPAPEISIRRFLSPRRQLPFRPGDYLMVQVWATNWVNGASQTGHLLFADLTQNWHFRLAFASSALHGDAVVGRSAEWVVERPDLIGHGLTSLANYTANPWTLVSARDLARSGYTPAAPGSARSVQITMFDDKRVAISRVRLYGNTALWFYNEGPSR